MVLCTETIAISLLSQHHKTAPMAPYFMCPNCQCLLTDAISLRCGHRFCQNCYSQLSSSMISQKQQTCPVCERHVVCIEHFAHLE